MTTYDSTMDDWIVEFLDFGVGVLSLVCLSVSVVWGLVAQDRILLDARQRLLAQAVHRTAAAASIVFLLMHIGTKLALEHTTWIAAVIPFGLLATNEEAFGGRAVLIGLGTLASHLLIFVAITGVLRNRFASPAPVAARWRAMHMLAYPAWCVALLHGLLDGREAKPFIMVLYYMSLVAVGGALVLRAAPQPFRHKVARRIQSTVQSRDRGLREEPRARRATAASPMRGADPRPGIPKPREPQRQTLSPSSPLYGAKQRSALTDTGGFAAAYRAVSSARSAADPLAQPLYTQPTDSTPPVDGDTSARWPAPFPPLYEAPPRPAEPPTTYNPVYATSTNGMPYGTPATPSYGSNGLYDTGETIDPLGTYYPSDTYDSGPATETLPGAFESPSSGETWNAPSGGIS